MTGSLWILVVDDQPDIRRVAARFLSREGFRSDEAASAEEALEKLLLRIPDVVCLDVELPGLSGMEALERMRKLYPGLPVIVLSGNDDEQTIAEAMRRGASRFLGKPFDRSALVGAVRAVLRERSPLLG